MQACNRAGTQRTRRLPRCNAAGTVAAVVLVSSSFRLDTEACRFVTPSGPAMRSILIVLALGLPLTTAFAADQFILGRQLLVQAPTTPDKRRVAVDAREWPSPNSVVGNP